MSNTIWTHMPKMGLSTWKCAVPFGDSHRLESCQRIAQKETPPPWVLRMHTYPRPLEAPHPTHIFHISGRRFWGQIRQKRTRSTFNYVLERKIQAYQRLDGQLILRNKPPLGLRSLHPQHINAGIHKEAPAQVQT